MSSTLAGTKTTVINFGNTTNRVQEFGWTIKRVSEFVWTKYPRFTLATVAISFALTDSLLTIGHGLRRLCDRTEMLAELFLGPQL